MQSAPKIQTCKIAMMQIDPWTFEETATAHSVSKLYFFQADMGPNETWQIMCEFDASKKGPR